MAKYISVTETAKLIRQELKNNFKGIKFSVRSNSYAGGASIDVSWTDGPCEPDVSRIVKRFESASFDGMTDSTTYHTGEWNGEEVHFGSDYVMTNRKYSWAFITAIAEQFCRHYGLPYTTILLNGKDEDAWANTKNLDYSQEHWFSDLLRNTDVKNMHRAYAAKDEQEARQHAEYEAFAQEQAKRQAEAKTKAEKEAKEREEAEFAQWQCKYIHNEDWQKEQFKLWKKEQERKAREEVERKEKQRRDEQQARYERERINTQKRNILATKANALAYLGLPINASRDVILAAFRAKVKAFSDGQGGYTGDMDLLVRAKKTALK